MTNLDLPDYLPDWMSDHIKVYLEDPEKAHLWDASLGGGKGMLPTLLLITMGRKSGIKRPLPLIYKNVGNAYVVIASNGGAPAHPSWYLNLVAGPECEIHVGKQQMQAVARTAAGAERERLWAELVEIYPPYADYQKSAGTRLIPVVVLEPQ